MKKCIVDLYVIFVYRFIEKFIKSRLLDFYFFFFSLRRFGRICRGGLGSLWFVFLGSLCSFLCLFFKEIIEIIIGRN